LQAEGIYILDRTPTEGRIESSFGSGINRGTVFLRDSVFIGRCFDG